MWIQAKDAKQFFTLFIIKYLMLKFTYAVANCAIDSVLVLFHEFEKIKTKSVIKKESHCKRF